MNWCTTEWPRHRRPKHFAARRPAADAQGVDRSKAASRAGSPADDFALQKEKQEAYRKRIEAQGIRDFRDFQPTVTQNIRYVYVRNLPGQLADLETTRCPNCKLSSEGTARADPSLVPTSYFDRAVWLSDSRTDCFRYGARNLTWRLTSCVSFGKNWECWARFIVWLAKASVIVTSQRNGILRNSASRRA